VLRGRTELTVALPEPAYVDVEDAFAALHAAEPALAREDWRRAWAPALTAQFVARRRFLPEAEQPWSDPWRRRLADVHVRALECYATACLRLGGGELAATERAARELLEVAPLRETGHLLLMESLAARGNVAEALAAYERCGCCCASRSASIPAARSRTRTRTCWAEQDALTSRADQPR
jgi:DNA-binding SARP family transcriptional activator